MKRRCGTPTGYSQHQLLDEKPCDACTKAKAAYDKRRLSAPEMTQKNRLRARAQGRAVTKLRHLHPYDWANLYAEALDEVYKENKEDLP